jgi:hypothetical protein
VSLLAGVAASAAMLLPAGAGAAVVGPKDLIATGNANTCFPATDCSFANLKLPADAGTVRSPISGRITKWRAEFEVVPSGGGPVRLQVLRRTDNPAGLRNDRFRVLRETADAFVGSTGVNTFPADMRIREGDFIAFASNALDANLGFNEVPGSTFGIWNGVLAPGDESSPDEFPSFPAYLLYNATVRG